MGRWRAAANAPGGGVLAGEEPVAVYLPLTDRLRQSLLPAGLCLAALLLVFASAAPARAQTRAALVVEADEVLYDDVRKLVEATGHVRLTYRGIRVSADRVVFDLQAERLTAQGSVALVDARGQELRGETLTYDVRLEQADVTGAETVIDGVYVRSARLVARPDRVEAFESVATTCDPAAPPYRVTASRIEVIPGDRLTAHGATLWLGARRILSLPVLTISLRGGEETARSLPRSGYNTIDGLWVDYRFRPAPGTFPWYLYAQLGTLAQRIEAGVEANTSLGTSGAAYLLARVGWHRETGVNLSTSRLLYEVGLRTASPVRISEATIWQGAVSFSNAQYGTGDRQSVLRGNAGLIHHLNDRVSLDVSYSVLEVAGATPLAFDTVRLEDRVHRATMQVVRTGQRGTEIATRASLGAAYNFRDATPSVLAGYGERAPARYHWTLGTEYNLTTRALRLSADVGRALGPGSYVTVRAVYDTATQHFADLDLIVTARLCDCFDLALFYRSVRQEIWITLALAPVLQERRGSP